MIIAALDKPLSKSRFAALDGLRAFAVLGVLWIHIWTVHGNPRYVVGKLDLASVLALGGNGVDLFFVISGFCMYYFYAGNRQFCYADFGAFLKKRWIRLSPAFYTACLVYIIAKLTHDGSYPFLKSALTCLTYQNALFSAYNPEGILWSLTPEWQFYIIVPFLLIYQNRYGFIKSFTVITICLFAIAIAGVMFLKSGSDILSSQIFFRYFEFMWGILAGRLLLLQPNLKLPYKALWLIGFILITYAGRVLISKPVLMLSTNYYNLFKLLGFTVMGFGFSGIIYLALTSKQRLKNFLGNKVFSFIGKISFSLYLWHGLVHRPVCNWVIILFPNTSGISLPVISFFISLIILIPLSAASYYLLEHNFMARNKTSNHK